MKNLTENKKEIISNEEMVKLFDIADENQYFAQRYTVVGKNRVEATFLVDLGSLLTIKAIVNRNGQDISQIYYNQELCESLHNRLENRS